MAACWALPSPGSRPLGPAGREEAALGSLNLEGAAGPDVLKRHGGPMRLPVVIYFDSSPRSWWGIAAKKARGLSSFPL